MSITGKLYKQVSLFTLSLVLAISGLGVAAPLYFSQIVHATPGAPILTLTVPPTKTITRSALVPEETNGTPTGGNNVVNTAINGLNVIPVTLANTGDADSDNVRISRISTDSHIQLWAKDTSDNWFDINVTGWMDSAGMSIPVGFNKTTDVYAISDTTGDYPLTVNLVDVTNPLSPVQIAGATAIGTVTVVAPETIEIQNVVLPSDSSSWNFGIDAGGGLWDTWKTNGYTSGQIEVAPGQHSVVGQTAPGTDGTKYFSSLECKDGDVIVATAGPASLIYGQNLASPGFNVASGHHIVCTFTNTLAGTIELKNVISPVDTNNWNLGIDASYTFWAQQTSNGYHSGPISVIPGNHSVVGQVGYNDYGFTDGTKYISSLECKDGNNFVVATANPASLNGDNLVSSGFNVASDQHIVCTFTQTKIPPDATPPSVNFVNPTPGNESYVKGTITGQVSATDAVGMGSYYIRVWKNAFGSGTLVKQCSSAPGGNLLGTSQDVTCGLDTTTLTPGKYVFSAQFLDSSSNWGTAFRTFYVDNTVPTATIDGLAPQSLYNGSTNINVHAIDDNYLRTDIYREGETSPLPYAGVYFGLSWLGNGNYRMVVIDKAGNSTEYKFTIDKTAPTVPSFVMKDSNGVDITNGYITTQYFTVNLTNPSAEGVVRYRLQYSNDFNSLVWNPSDLSATGHMSNLGVYTDNFTQGEGTHSLAFSACDAAGNCSAYSDPFVVTYDNTKPVVTVTTPVADNYGFINTVNINANIDDAVSYSIYVNGTDVHDGIGEYIPYALTVTDGAYDMYIEATDAAGNVGTSLVLTITVDNTAPILTVIGYTGTSLTPTITGTTDGAGYRVTVDGVEATVNSDGTWAYTLPTQTIGTHTISVVSTDIYGNAKTELATVTVNAVPATNTTPATTTTTVTPTGTTTNNTTDQGVLGAQTTKDTTDNTTTPAKTAASILGDSTSKDNGNIWGLVWYWWLVILAAAVAIIWWIVAAMRSRDNQNT